MAMSTDKSIGDPASLHTTAIERFLCAIEQKTNDPVHKKLLAASRVVEIKLSLEEELNRILSEILHDN
jgi:hypothetical protein